MLKINATKLGAMPMDKIYGACDRHAVTHRRARARGDRRTMGLARSLLRQCVAVAVDRRSADGFPPSAGFDEAVRASTRAIIAAHA